MFYDCHSHTKYSVDSKLELEDGITNALNSGLLGYAFTDHCDLLLESERHCTEKIKSCCEEAELLKEKYKDKITVMTGLELADGFYCPELYKKAKEQYDYDIVLGSVHLIFVDNKMIDMAWLDFSDTPKDYLRKMADSYFKLYKNMVYNGDYDVFCHLTYLLRYINIPIDDYIKDIEDIMKICISKGTAMEINLGKCSSENPRNFCPESDFVKLYKSLGGEKITLGSDLHVEANKYPFFAEAAKMLKDVGYDKLYYFEKRVPKSYKI